MSAPPHDGWPKVGDIFPHWSDLQLAILLAALRAGYNTIGRHWDAKSPDRLYMVCNVTENLQRDQRCQHRLVEAKPVDPTDLAGSWIVSAIRLENLEVGRHSHHYGSTGTSDGFKSRPSKTPKLFVGRVVEGWRSLHALEASLRISSRLEGRFIVAYPQLKSTNKPEQGYSQFFACTLGHRCTFYVRLIPHKHSSGEGWKCANMCLDHTCSSQAPPICRSLEQIFAFWPTLRVEGKSLRYGKRDTRDRNTPSIIDAYLGDYPVLPCGEDGKPIRPIVADVRLSAKLETRRSVLSKALESLAVARRTHLVTNTKLFTAEIADSVDEANKLKIEVAAAAKQVRKKERKVGRKRAKVERMKERIEKDKMERIEKDKMERRKLAGQEAKKPKLKKEKKKDQQKSNVTET